MRMPFSGWSRRRLANVLLAATLLIGLCGLAVFGARAGLHLMENRAIAALAAGRDLPVAEGASPGSCWRALISSSSVTGWMKRSHSSIASCGMARHP
ncbi:hypothetical protein EZH22_24235 [Xanthobacter dioxanivorans]|uniref:Uncharacterized protein n=1 Tax=Xanthobacter dioxanivorans TaxID=2528964 RepID=A0A974SI53_9HYPH|nr:hypothetical protein [Xanthobacter dioxanivorans]QRG06067.1 hypothetical protein EZH22_24235 [Xanthobacter dioxanivorans]